MKISSLFAFPVPELRKRTLTQLFNLWVACAPYSRGIVYLHAVLLLATASVIFNAVLWFSNSYLLDLTGLAVGLTVPSNLYFGSVFNNRRRELQQYIKENWDEFAS